MELLGDLGGGSLELVDVKRTAPGLGESFPLGGLRLEEAAEKSLKKAEKMVADALAGSKVLSAGDKRPFYAHRRHVALACPPAHAADGIPAARHAPLRHQAGRSGGLLPDGVTPRY